MRRRDETTIWHLDTLSGALAGAAVMQADLHAFEFAPHFHAELAVGVIQQGRLNVQIGKHGRTTVRAGQLVVINPGEIHEGFDDGAAGCRYAMFYLPTAWLGEVVGKEGAVPHFPTCTLDAAMSAQQLARLYHTLNADNAASLAIEGELMTAVGTLIDRYAEGERVAHVHDTVDMRAMRQAQAYLADFCHEKVTLGRLAAEVGLSPFHLLRMFRRVVGMSPHAYQRQMRIDAAKSRLMRGDAIADVAVAMGFHDQSHLTKHFKAVVGLTPQRFRAHRNILQDRDAPLD